MEHIRSVDQCEEVPVKDALAGPDEVETVVFLLLVRPLDHVDAKNFGLLDQVVEGLEDDAGLTSLIGHGRRLPDSLTLLLR